MGFTVNAPTQRLSLSRVFKRYTTGITIETKLKKVNQTLHREAQKR
jgi:hypothetical protein